MGMFKNKRSYISFAVIFILFLMKSKEHKKLRWNLKSQLKFFISNFKKLFTDICTKDIFF